MFVAVLPPPEVVEHLDDFLSVRREAAAFRWSDPEQWHLTLAFAADVPDRSLDELDEHGGAAAVGSVVQALEALSKAAREVELEIRGRGRDR